MYNSEREAEHLKCLIVEVEDWHAKHIFLGENLYQSQNY